MRITTRDYRSDDDFVAVRRLLERTKTRTPLGFNWEVRRWDGLRWYRPDAAVDGWPVRLWMADGLCVGAVHDEGPGIAVLEVDPGQRHLEPAMLAWAESTLSATWPDGTQLVVHALDRDTTRRALLADRGYEVTAWGEVARSMPIVAGDVPIPLPIGYRLHAMDAGAIADRQRLADLLNAAFRRDVHGEAEFLTFADHAPCYRSELHLFAEAADGTFAAHAATNLDTHNAAAIIEPVCTHPDHVGRGLARALVAEAVRRAGTLGAVAAEVSTGLDPGLNRFYEKLGLARFETGHYWKAPATSG